MSVSFVFCSNEALTQLEGHTHFVDGSGTCVLSHLLRPLEHAKMAGCSDLHWQAQRSIRRTSPESGNQPKTWVRFRMEAWRICKLSHFKSCLSIACGVHKLVPSRKSFKHALEMTHKFFQFQHLEHALVGTHTPSQFKSHSECACGAHTSLYFSRVFQATFCGEHTNLPVCRIQFALLENICFLVS